MNPLLTEALGSIIRHFLTILSGYLVARGIWTGDKAEMYVAATATAILAVGWALFQKYKFRIKFLVALSSPVPKTENQVEQQARVVDVDVSTPKDVIPTTENK